MPSHKNQHFVPRCHFKPFTEAGMGSAINVFNIRSETGVRNAPVKGQSARNYFYGKDLEIEKMLQQGEVLYSQFVRRAGQPGYNIDDTDKLLIRRFIVLQHSRTEMAARRRALSMNDMRDAIYTSRGIKEEIDLSDETVIRESLQTCVQIWHMVDDLKVCLLSNDTDHSFITSDNPGIVTNRLYLQKLKQPKFGIGNSGTLLLLPLTPRICVLCYDGDVYSVPNAGGWVHLTKTGDIRSLNEHQFLKCASNIYFREWDGLPRIAEEFREVAQRRLVQPWELTLADLVASDDFGETYKVVGRDHAAQSPQSMLALSFIHPAPSRWPSVIGYRSSPTCFSNGSATGLVRRSIAETQWGGGSPYRKQDHF